MKIYYWKYYNKIIFKDINTIIRPNFKVIFARYYGAVWIPRFALRFLGHAHFPFFFFFWLQLDLLTKSVVNIVLMHCSQIPQITFFINFFIKNRSHNTIHTFKNYFTIVFSVFNFSKISSIQQTLYLWVLYPRKCKRRRKKKAVTQTQTQRHTQKQLFIFIFSTFFWKRKYCTTKRQTNYHLHENVELLLKQEE